jgi:uncharacterized membrane protein
MQGRATFHNHPIHPMLVALPIGFFIGTVVCYIVYGITGDTTFWPKMAVMLMIFGIIGALLSALFGFIDYFTAPMPPAVKDTATKHMVLNLAVVVIFLIAVWQGWGNGTNPVSIWLSVAGVILLAISGWLGGKLTFVAGVGAAENSSKIPAGGHSTTTTATREKSATR